MKKNNSILKFLTPVLIALLLCETGYIIKSQPDINYAKKTKKEFEKLDATKRKNDTIVLTAHEKFAQDSATVTEQMLKISDKIYQFIAENIYTHPYRANENFFIQEFDSLSLSEKNEIQKVAQWLKNEKIDTCYKSDLYEPILDLKYFKQQDIVCKNKLKIKKTNGNVLYVSKNLTQKLIKTATDYYQSLVYMSFNKKIIKTEKENFASWDWWNAYSPKCVMLCLPAKHGDYEFYFAVDTSNVIIKKFLNQELQKYKQLSYNQRCYYQKYNSVKSQATKNKLMQSEKTHNNVEAIYRKTQKQR
ncbi:MAG: hypothetical protein ACLRFI_00380 [Alphaproteobacteria bacterium]